MSFKELRDAYSKSQIKLELIEAELESSRATASADEISVLEERIEEARNKRDSDKLLSDAAFLDLSIN